MNLALQKRHEQLERWRQNEAELVEKQQAEAAGRQQRDDEQTGPAKDYSETQKKIANNNKKKFSPTIRRANISFSDQSSSIDETHNSARASKSRTNTRSASFKDSTNKTVGPQVKFTNSTLFLTACANGDLDECERLLTTNHVDINVTTCDGLTGLHEAAICGNVNLVEYLLARGADINCRDNEGWTPLHAAASLGQTKIVEILLDHEADATFINCENFLAYDLARNDECRDLIAKRLDGQDIEYLRSQEERIIEQDINQWIQTGQYSERSHPVTGATVLHVIAAKGYTSLMKKILDTPSLKKQMNLEAKDNEGYTPLLAASFWNQDNIVELLIEYGANIFAEANNGYKISSIGSSETTVCMMDALGFFRNFQPNTTRMSCSCGDQHLKNYQQSKLQQPSSIGATTNTRSSLQSLDSDLNSRSTYDGSGNRISSNLDSSDAESMGDNIPSASARHLRSQGQLLKSKSVEFGPNQPAETPLLSGSMSVDRLLLRAESMGERDLRKSFKELVMENERLKQQLKTFDDKDKQMQQEWIRTERQLQRKISELEEENKQIEHWRQEIQRLKDENSSLIRVVSKLSKH